MLPPGAKFDTKQHENTFFFLLKKSSILKLFANYSLFDDFDLLIIHDLLLQLSTVLY